MADIIAGIAPRVDTHANWTALNPVLGKDSGGKSYGQVILSTGSPVGNIMVWGNAQTYNVAYAAGQYMPAGEDVTVNNLTAAGDTSVQGFKRPTVVKTAAYIMTIDDYVVEVDSTAGPVSITLPGRSTALGRDFVIRKISSDSNTVTINRAGADTITRAGLTSVTLTSDGDWWKNHAGSTRWELVDGVESGSGFIKKSDGFLYVFGTHTVGALDINVSSLGAFRNASGTFVFTFPHAFVSLHSISALLNGSALSYADNNTTVTQGRLLVFSISSQTAVSVTADYTATGTWYT